MDNKMTNLISEIENAQQIADDVRAEIYKMNTEIKDVKEKKLGEIAEVVADFRKLMDENKIKCIETNPHEYLCGKVRYRNTVIKIVSGICGIRINLSNSNDSGDEIYTCMYGGTSKHHDTLHQDFLLENWDMFYDELIEDFKFRFDKSLESTHNKYESTVEEYNRCVKGE